eukprot:3371481-Amphidinium_carterae.1
MCRWRLEVREPLVDLDDGKAAFVVVKHQHPHFSNRVTRELGDDSCLTVNFVDTGYRRPHRVLFMLALQSTETQASPATPCTCLFNINTADTLCDGRSTLDMP